MTLLELMNAKWVVQPMLLLDGAGYAPLGRALWFAKLTVYSQLTPTEEVLVEGVPLELQALGRDAGVAADMFPHIRVKSAERVTATANGVPHVLVPVDAAMQIPRHISLTLLEHAVQLFDVDTRGNAAALFCGLPPGELVLPP